jgi:hypothetical protein
MNLREFEASAERIEPPAGVSQELIALWYERRGDWDRAHTIVQEISTTDASWVHAYLHRKEGDLANAGYWYRRAGRQLPAVELTTEWKEIAAALLLD